MKIKIDNDIKAPLLEAAKLANISPDLVMEYAFVFSVKVSQLPKEQLKTLYQWVEDLNNES